MFLATHWKKKIEFLWLKNKSLTFGNFKHPKSSKFWISHFGEISPIKNNSEFWLLARRLSKIVKPILTLNHSFKIEELGQRTNLDSTFFHAWPHLHHTPKLLFKNIFTIIIKTLIIFS